jgi:hypothetical protein
MEDACRVQRGAGIIDPDEEVEAHTQEAEECICRTRSGGDESE